MCAAVLAMHTFVFTIFGSLVGSHLPLSSARAHASHLCWYIQCHHRQTNDQKSNERRGTENISLLWWHKLDKDSHSFTFICLFVSDFYFHAGARSPSRQLLHSTAFSLRLPRTTPTRQTVQTMVCVGPVGWSVSLFVCAFNFVVLFASCQFQLRRTACRRRAHDDIRIQKMVRTKWNI